MPMNPAVAMAPVETYEQRGGVAILRLDNPPINSLDLATRQTLAAGLARAQADATVHAVVITGAGNAFSGGADIREFGTPAMAAEPHLLTLIDLVERASKPVVAAIGGACVGGGLELSLACHYRVAAPGASLALPEVRIGLVPGAGGTQRLPRALGLEAALQMILTGKPMRSEAVFQVPGQMLVDRLIGRRGEPLIEMMSDGPLLIDGDLLEGAVRFATEVAERAAAGEPLPRLRDRVVDHPMPAAVFHAARAQALSQAGHLPAPVRCIDCVEQAVSSPFDVGLRYERDAFATLMATPESKALRHAFFAERAAGKIADVPADTPTRAVDRVAVVGAGTMGSGIAITLLNSGLPVTLLEQQPAALDKGTAAIQRYFDGQVAKGRIDPAQRQQRLALLQPTLDCGDLSDADLVIEAVFEDLAVKQAVFEALDTVLKPGAILASNTSTLDLNRIASFTRRPEDVVGLHFFSPAPVMKLLEVVRGRATAKDVLATAMQLGRRLNKTCVVAGVSDGFIGNRMIEQYLRQAGLLLDEGCSPEQVDRAIEQFGFAMGPFKMSDLAGNDIGWAIRRRRALEHPTMRYSRSADLLCEQGRFGQKTAAGWYDYLPGEREAFPSGAVNALLAQHRATLAVVSRPVEDTEIVDRLVLALVNEGARILEEGVAQRASDIDMVYLTGYGFPPWRGGPMHHANTLGLAAVVQRMHAFAENPQADSDFWTPAPLLARLAAAGGRFGDR